MSMYEHQLQVLTILSENLHNPQPQLVPTSSIAGKMDIQLRKLQSVLNIMNAMGLIQTSLNLQYNLITRKGLDFLGARRGYFPGNL